MANELEYGLQSLLATTPAVSTLIGTRIFPLLLPSDSATPAVTYQRISTVTLHTMTSNVALATSRVQFDVWAPAYIDARSAASAIVQQLEGFQGDLPNTVHVSDVVLDNETDLFDSVAKLHRVSLDLLITFVRQ